MQVGYPVCRIGRSRILTGIARACHGTQIGRLHIREIRGLTELLTYTEMYMVGASKAPYIIERLSNSS